MTDETLYCLTAAEGADTVGADSAFDSAPAPAGWTQMAHGEASDLRRHRWPAIGLRAFFLGVVVYFVAVLLNPWSRLYNEEQELDLNSGRARFTRHVLYFQVWQDVRETPLSQAVNASEKVPGDEHWVMVNVFGLGTRKSPYFTYHGALAQVQLLANYWDTGDFDAAARSKTARQLLRVLREGGYPGGYFKLLDEGLISRPSGQPTTDRDIPDDLDERALTAYAGKTTATASSHGTRLSGSTTRASRERWPG